MTELVVQNTPNVPVRADLFSAGPTEMLAQASQIASVLKDVITKQKLTTRIGPNEYVRVEGWSTLGCMLGFLPREKEVVELEDGSYLATVELYNLRTGAIVGQASALCGKDEKRWATADRYARRSMAITRATGKAYRLGFSWVMTLAGYQPTPAEEIPEDEVQAARPSVRRPVASIYTGTEEQQQKVETILRQKKVPESLWPDVDKLLRGKPSTELNNVIAEAQRNETTKGAFES